MPLVGPLPRRPPPLGGGGPLSIPPPIGGGGGDGGGSRGSRGSRESGPRRCGHPSSSSLLWSSSSSPSRRCTRTVGRRRVDVWRRGRAGVSSQSECIGRGGRASIARCRSFWAITRARRSPGAISSGSSWSEYWRSGFWRSPLVSRRASRSSFRSSCARMARTSWCSRSQRALLQPVVPCCASC